MTKSNKFKILIISISIVVSILLCVLVTTLLINGIKHPNKNSPDNNPPSTLNPVIICEDEILIDILTDNYILNYTIDNFNNQNVTISVEDNTIATINEDYVIIPNKVGTTIITISVNCEPVVEKIITLTIKDVISDITYKFYNSDNKETNEFYVNKTYTLEIYENKITDEEVSLGYDDNFFSDFKLISKLNNCKIYSFKITNLCNTTLKYKAKYFEKDIIISSIIFPEDFNVNFSQPIINNEINLYLFNETYTALANNDNYFNNLTFSINKVENSNDEVEYNFNGDFISIVNNKITALKKGVTTLTFKSKISKIEKIYTINVLEIGIDKIIFNNNEYSLNSEINLEINSNTFNYNINFFPIYFYKSIETNLTNVTINNNLCEINETSGKIEITYNNSAIFRININLIESQQPTYYIQVQKGQTETTIIQDNNTFTITYSSGAYFSILAYIYDDLTNKVLSNQDLEFNIENQNIISNANLTNQVNSGNIFLKINSIGSTFITLSSKEYNLTYQILINIIA